MSTLTLNWSFPHDRPGVPAAQQPVDDGLTVALTAILLGPDYACETVPILFPGTSCAGTLPEDDPTTSPTARPCARIPE